MSDDEYSSAKTHFEFGSLSDNQESKVETFQPLKSFCSEIDEIDIVPSKTEYGDHKILSFSAATKEYGPGKVDSYLTAKYRSLP